MGPIGLIWQQAQIITLHNGHTQTNKLEKDVNNLWKEGTDFASFFRIKCLESYFPIILMMNYYHWLLTLGYIKDGLDWIEKSHDGEDDWENINLITNHPQHESIHK